MKNIPETIFLQIDEYGKDAKSFKELETTWCTDKLNEDDIEYILKSKYEELEHQKEKILSYINKLENDSFEGWNEDEKGGYLTACFSIKKKIEEVLK